MSVISGFSPDYRHNNVMFSNYKLLGHERAFSLHYGLNRVEVGLVF